MCVSLLQRQREQNTLANTSVSVSGAYRAVPRAALGSSDHATVQLKLSKLALTWSTPRLGQLGQQKQAAHRRRLSDSVFMLRLTPEQDPSLWILFTGNNKPFLSLVCVSVCV